MCESVRKTEREMKWMGIYTRVWFVGRGEIDPERVCISFSRVYFETVCLLILGDK